MKFTYTFTCRIFHANIMQIKPPITYSYLLMKSQHSISRRPHQNMYTYQITLLYCQILVYKDAFQHQSWCIHVKECMLDLAISYAILKSFTEIGRNFVAALCNSISLRLFIDLLSEHTHSIRAHGSGICRFSAFGKTLSQVILPTQIRISLWMGFNASL